MLRALGVVLSVLCFLGAWQGPWGFLAWVAWIPLFYATQDASLKDKLILFSLTGLCVYIPLISWLIPTSIVGWLLVSCYMSLYFTAFAWFYHRWSVTAVWRLACVWVMLEIFREWFGTGLPWLALGDSQASQESIRHIVEVFGSKYLSWLIVCVNLTLAGYLKQRSKRSLILVAVSVLIVVITMVSSHRLGLEPKNKGTSYPIAAIHTDISLEMKWDEAQFDAVMQHYIDLSRAAKLKQDDLKLIIWPETGVPTYVRRRPLVFGKIAALSKELNTPILVGALDMSSVEGKLKRYYNSAFLILPSKVIAQKYDKIKIVPFGEYTPFGNVFPWFKDLIKGDTDFDRGRGLTVFHLGDMRWATLICFEEAFSSFVGRFVHKGINFLVVTSNDAWFSSHQVTQRLKMSQMRAVEYGKDVIRVSNRGESYVIDSSGYLTARLAHAGSLIAYVNHSNQDLTLYARWGMSWFWILAIFIFGGQKIYDFRERKRKVTDPCLMD